MDYLLQFFVIAHNPTLPLLDFLCLTLREYFFLFLTGVAAFDLRRSKTRFMRSLIMSEIVHVYLTQTMCALSVILTDKLSLVNWGYGRTVPLSCPPILSLSVPLVVRLSQ